VGEPQKRERLRPPQTCLRSSFGREQPKLNEPGLALIERQAKLGQPLSERFQQSLYIVLVLSSNDTIIGVAHGNNPSTRVPLAPLVNPSVKDVMQKDVGQ